MRHHVHSAQPGGTCLPRPGPGRGADGMELPAFGGTSVVGKGQRGGIPLTVRQNAVTFDICVEGAQWLLGGWPALSPPLRTALGASGNPFPSPVI